jgi:hypothetical protein
MVEADGDKREPPWLAGYRKPEGDPEDKRRLSAYLYPAGRLKVYPLEPRKIGFVYVFRDAKALVKIGLSATCAMYRCKVVSSLVPHAHRPVRFVTASAMRLDQAYKVERLAKHLMEHRHVEHGGFTEWFQSTPGAASRAVNAAVNAVMQAEFVFGRNFAWRKALLLHEASGIWANRKYANDGARMAAIEKRLGKCPGRTTLRNKFGSPHKGRG